MPTRTTDLRKRVVLVGAPVAIAVIALGAYLASRGTSREFARQSERQIRATARGAAVLLDRYLRERHADIEQLARTSDAADIALAADAEATRLRLEEQTHADLDVQFAGTGGLLADADARAFLEAAVELSDLAEISVVESRGYLALSTDPNMGFVHAATDWWAQASESGRYEGEPFVDDSASAVWLDLATAIRVAPSAQVVGFLYARLDLSTLSILLASTEYALGSTVEVVDSAGRLIVTRDAARLFTRVEHSESIQLSGETNLSSPPGERNVLIASTPANDGRWWIVVRQRQEAAFNAAKSVQDTVYLASGIALVLAMFLIAWLTDWLHRRVTQPLKMASAVASRVADGDLSASVVRRTAATEEVQRLLDSFDAMVIALRNLVGEIRSAAQESAAMAEQISAATEEMSASTQQMADTCQDLTSQATEQAELTRLSSEAADRILGISTSLAEGAKVAAERSSALVGTAGEHRARLIEGGTQLAGLASELEQGAAEAKRLADLSEEIQRFVSQARGIASQTNMLALNAAIEASRASGGEGRGFAVVADEVRKLANQTARSAATTGDVVRSVLATVQETQDRLERLAEASSAVREIAESAANALEEVADATAESSAWSEEIARAADDVKQLVADISERLRTIAVGTDSIVAASEEIAASAEQQSASTEQIAASATQLADASQHLTSAVSSFRLQGKGTPRSTDGERASEQTPQ